MQQGGTESACDEQQREQQQQGQAMSLTAQELPQLPIEVLTIIATGLPRSTLPRLRLCSSQFEAAVAPLVTSITFTDWPGKPHSLKRLNQTARLQFGYKPIDTEPCSTRDSQGTDIGKFWLQLEWLVSQLPRLNSLLLPTWGNINIIPKMPANVVACLAALTRLDMHDLDCLPDNTQLPQLRAASFVSSDASLDLAAIAALAPNLEQFSCKRLDITADATLGAGTAAAAGGVDAEQSAADNADAAAAQHDPVPAVLASCTHFGAQAVTVAGTFNAAAAAAAFGAAFPAMKVMFTVPQVAAPQGEDAAYDELLAQLPRLTAIRGKNWFSSRTWLHIRSSEHLARQHWQHVTRISFHSNSYPDGSSDFLDISKAQQLKHVRLTFNYPYTKADELVQELQKLPALTTLALPAALLCNRCCPERFYPGLRSALERLAANTTLQSLELLTPPAGAAAGATYYCGHPDSVKEGMVALKAKAVEMRCSRVQRQKAADAAAGLADSSQEVALEQQQGLLLGVPQHDLTVKLVVEGAEVASCSCPKHSAASHPVWGEYVSATEW